MLSSTLYVCTVLDITEGLVVTGLLEAAKSSINNRDRAIALVLDADMIVQPGALEKIADATISKRAIAYPIVWQTCHGISLGALKGRGDGWVCITLCLKESSLHTHTLHD